MLGWQAAALKLTARDRWIGWSPQQRRRRLHLLTQNSRFLILPGFHAGNLASRVLGLSLRRLAGDMLAVHGFPVLLAETFCETPRFHGTCYRAANWIHVGQTQGRGKLDTHHQYSQPVKNIFVKPLCPDWKAILNR